MLVLGRKGDANSGELQKQLSLSNFVVASLFDAPNIAAMDKRLSYSYGGWEMPVTRYVGIAFDGFAEDPDWIVVNYVPADMDDPF